LITQSHDGETYLLELGWRSHICWLPRYGGNPGRSYYWGRSIDDPRCSSAGVNCSNGSDSGSSRFRKGDETRSRCCCWLNGGFRWLERTNQHAVAGRYKINVSTIKSKDLGRQTTW
jgi:hypothetical protein